MKYIIIENKTGKILESGERPDDYIREAPDGCIVLTGISAKINIMMPCIRVPCP